MEFELSSSSFADGHRVPREHTCDGEDLSPPLSWTGFPPDTQSFALIVDDPDCPDPKAPRMTWVHWVLYNLPSSCTHLARGVEPSALPAGAREGLNDWKSTGYRGPCPPSGEHRYFHKLYALDVALPELGTPTKAELLDAMGSHILAETHLVGTYLRHR